MANISRDGAEEVPAGVSIDQAESDRTNPQQYFNPRPESEHEPLFPEEAKERVALSYYASIKNGIQAAEVRHAAAMKRKDDEIQHLQSLRAKETLAYNQTIFEKELQIRELAEKKNEFEKDFYDQINVGIEQIAMNTQLQQDFDALSLSCQQKDHQIQIGSHEYSRLRGQNTVLETEKAQLTSDLDKRKEENRRLSTRVDNLLKDNKVLSQLKDSVIKQTNQTSSELEAERVKLNDTKQELQNSQAELAQRNQVVAELKKEMELVTKKNIQERRILREAMETALFNLNYESDDDANVDPDQPALGLDLLTVESDRPAVKLEQLTVQPDQPITKIEQPTDEPRKAGPGPNQDNHESLKQHELKNQQRLAALHTHAVGRQSTKRGSGDEIMTPNTKHNRTI